MNRLPDSVRSLAKDRSILLPTNPPRLIIRNFAPIERTVKRPGDRILTGTHRPCHIVAGMAS